MPALLDADRTASLSTDGAILRVVCDDEGQLVVRKSATTDSARHRLRHEAEILDLARQPGVVTLAGVEDTDGATTVVTHFVGSQTLATFRPCTLAEAAALAAALAETLGDLHARGIEHGRVGPDHVVIDAAGRPVLCGFAEARHDEATRGGDDVAALAEVLRDLVRGGDPTAGPGRRRWRIGRRAEGDHRRVALDHLVDRVTAGDQAHRPGARAFADAVVTIVPDARLPIPRHADVSADPETGTDLVTGPGSRSSDLPASIARPRPRRDGAGRVPRHGPSPALAAGVGALVVALVLAGLGVALLMPDAARPGLDRGGVPADRMDVAAPTTPSSTSSAPPTTSTGPASPTSAVAPSTAMAATDTEAPTRDVTADPRPAPDPALGAVLPGGLVDHEGQRYVLGEVGDEVALGDWDCDGTVTPVLLRTTTGRLYAFPGWPGPGEDVAARDLGTLDIGSHLAPPAAGSNGCTTLRATAPTGEVLDLPFPADTTMEVAP
jgi:predicted Ser/Thr protein kinase